MPQAFSNHFNLLYFCLNESKWKQSEKVLKHPDTTRFIQKHDGVCQGTDYAGKRIQNNERIQWLKNYGWTEEWRLLQFPCE